MRARQATPTEAQRLWPILQSHYRFFDAYGHVWRDSAMMIAPVVAEPAKAEKDP